MKPPAIEANSPLFIPVFGNQPSEDESSVGEPSSALPSSPSEGGDSTVTRSELFASSWEVSPIAETTKVVVAVTSGATISTSNAPSSSAVASTTVSSSLKVRVTDSPGANPEPLTVKLSPVATSSALKSISGAYGSDASSTSIDVEAWLDVTPSSATISTS